RVQRPGQCTCQCRDPSRGAHGRRGVKAVDGMDGMEYGIAMNPNAPTPIQRSCSPLWMFCVVSVVALCEFCAPARSDSDVFDSFNTGGLNLNWNGAIFDVDPIQFFANQRRVQGGGHPGWAASLDASDGILR